MIWYAFTTLDLFRIDYFTLDTVHVLVVRYLNDRRLKDNVAFFKINKWIKQNKLSKICINIKLKTKNLINL